MIRPALLSARPSAAYHAPAVHWDGTSHLHNDALVSGTTPLMSFVLWYKQPVITGPPNLSGFWATDPQGAFSSYAEADFPVGMSPASVQYSIGNPDGLPVAESGSVGDGNVAPQGMWHCYMGSCDCTAGGPGNIARAYIDDVSLTAQGDPFPGPVAGNGVPLWIGNINEAGGAYDMALFFMWYGVSINFSNTADRRNFFSASGKPVNPAVPVAAYGTPTVLLNGNSSTFGTNQGPGGPFTLTGGLTNASSSPSG